MQDGKHGYGESTTREYDRYGRLTGMYDEEKVFQFFHVYEESHNGATYSTWPRSRELEEFHIQPERAGSERIWKGKTVTLGDREQPALEFLFEWIK